MNVATLVKSLPAILRGNAIVITINEKRVQADCGRLGKTTVQEIARKLLEKTKQ